MSKHLVSNVGYVECPYCGKDGRVLQWKHLKTHGKILDDVRKEFPNLPTMTEEYHKEQEEFRELSIGLSGRPRKDEVQI